MNKVVLVTGSGGQLGSEIQYLKQTGYELAQHDQYLFVASSDLDVTDGEKLASYCKINNVDVIVNCAAYTAVDKAEDDPDGARAVNCLAVKNMAEISKLQDIALVHISTDYVFDGESNKPYAVNDEVNPKNVYGETKLGGEVLMKEVNPANSVIIRTSWVYSSFSSNFVKTMLRLGSERPEISVVCDQVGAPTYARDLAKAIITIIPHLDHVGVRTYHYCNTGVCSWYDFAKAIFHIKGVDCRVLPLKAEAYPTPAVRPYYSAMDTSALSDDYEVEIPYWRDSLAQMIKSLK